MNNCEEVLSNLFSTLDIDENIIYIFITPYHLFKDNDKLKESGFLQYSVLMWDKKLILNSSYMRDVYVANKNNDNILLETEKKYAKFKVKFIYLKFSNFKVNFLNWEYYQYMLDEKKYDNYMYLNERIKNSKIEIYENNILKFKINGIVLVKNMLTNLQNISDKKIILNNFLDKK